MEDARLIAMANQIAAAFAANGEAEAIAATEDHLRKFWDLRMRRQVLALDPAGLTPIARAAVERLRAA
jgi:formate dehydrogenase subunit delta